MKGKEDSVRSILMNGVRKGVFPGAVLLAAHGHDIVLIEVAGNRSLSPDDFPMNGDTIFDLASLTKPLATSLALMKLVDEQSLSLDQPLETLLSVSLPLSKKSLTCRQILSHSAGFPAWKPYYEDLVKFRPDQRKSMVRRWILDSELVYPPGRDALYSDLGFIILEWVVEELAGMALDLFVEGIFRRHLLLDNTFLGNPMIKGDHTEEDFAATERCKWRKRVMRGEVHDENAFALGGFSGHSGLFGPVRDVYKIVDLLREHYAGLRQDVFKPDTVREFFTKQKESESFTWALGWDTPSRGNSSSGRHFHPGSVGHLGFTGTSMWLDLEQNVIVVLFTNRVHPTRNNLKIKEFRPLLHDAVMETLGCV
ncbi:MAG: serine hydrolase [Thermodesulfobacteriota bacterium]|nr:serine hydrolase [Thermodesulfobacteriota bacterium]